MTENKYKQTGLDVKAALNDQKELTVKYKEGKENKKIKITVQDPGVDKALAILDLTETGNELNDIPEAYDLVMKHVLVEPKLSYHDLNEKLAKMPKSYREQEIKHKNAEGKDIKLRFKFPDYRTALSIIFEIKKNNGGSNLRQSIKDICENVIVDENGKHVDIEYFDRGHEGSGLTLDAMREATEFLSKPIDHKGLGNILGQAFQFSIQTLSAVK